MKAIEVKNLMKSYKGIDAVNNISFDVDRNSFFALLGPNGAGKSTTINILATLLECDAGRISICGHSLGSEDYAIRKKTGIVFQNSMLDDLLTVRENLLIRGAFYGIGTGDLEQRVGEINELLEILPFFNQRYGTLSGGQKRKADIARALLNWPEILILDEPTTGLDPGSRKDIWELINRLRTEKDITIFLTTHYMEETQDANKIIIMDQGKIIACGSSEELRKRYTSDRIKIHPRDGLRERLASDSVEYERHHDSLIISLKDCFEGIGILEKYKGLIEGFEIMRGRMDDVFLNITGRELGGES